MSLHQSAVRLSISLALLVLLAACGGAETRMARHLQRGETFMAEGNYEKARVEFRNALQIAPEDPQARYMAGQVAEKLKNPREAVGLYLAIMDKNPEHVKARASLGRLYVFGGAPKKALELVEPALAKGEDTNLLTVRGAARIQTGDMPGALADAKRALELDASNENARALLASVYRQTGKNDEALALLREGIKLQPKSADLRMVLVQLCAQTGDRPCAEQELTQVIALSPQEPPARYQLALFYLAGKDVDKAEQVLRETVKVIANDNGPKFALVDFLANQRSPAAAENEYLAFIAHEPKNAALQLGLGQFYERNKQPQKAEALYRTIIGHEHLNADGLSARNRIAALKVQSGKIDEAQALIAEVLKENPRDNDALIMRGNLALARNDAATAIADLRAVLRDQPKATAVLRALARAHLQNNEQGLAEENLRAAVEANPKELESRVDLAQLLAQRGQLPESVQLLERAVREAPQNVSAREVLFRAQLAAKQWDAAKQTADDVKVLKPDSGLGDYFAGLVAEAQGKLDQSSAEFEHGLQLQPSAADVLTALVRVKMTQKQPDAALKALDTVLARAPENAVARNLKGEVLLSVKRFPEAEQALQGATEKAPQWWLPYRNLALSQLARKDLAGAIGTYNRGLQTAQEPTPLALDLASIYEREGKSQDAIAVYEKLLERKPKLEVAANNLAMLLVTYRQDRGSLDRARELSGPFANSAVPAYLNTYGWVKYKRGEFDAALPTLQQAVEKSPDSALMRYHLGMALYQTGALDKARENLELAVKAQKSFAGVEEAKTTLAKIESQKKSNG